MTTVVRTPEFSQVQILKPFSGFESVYEGQLTLTNPIAIPGSLDSLAGSAGYDPNLLAGTAVPMGSRVLLWLPTYFPDNYNFISPYYRYTICWRIRALREQLSDGSGLLTGHFGVRFPGVAQEPSIPPVPNQEGPRFVVPAAYEPINIPYYANSFVGTWDVASRPWNMEPLDVSITRKRLNPFAAENNGSGADGQYYAPLSPSFPPGGVQPLAKFGAAGMISQGSLSDQNGTGGPLLPMNPGWGGGPQFHIYETTAKGDEMILLIDRTATLSDGSNHPNWEFAGVDKWLSNVLGTFGGTRPEIPTLGVYMLTGSAT